MSKRKTYDIGRDATTGQFVPVAYANKHKSTTVVERIKKCNNK